MDLGINLKKKSGDLLDLARRARRMAAGLSQATDRARVNRHADELEKQAAELEQEAARPIGPTVIVPTPVTHTQQQVQQQQGSEPIPEPPLPKK
jgi:hypothetical protein